MKSEFTFLKAVQKCTDAFLVAAIFFCFICMFGFTNANVIARYVFAKPIIISQEIARYGFVDIIFLGAIFTMRYDAHLSLDFFVSRLPKPAAFYITMGGRFLTEIFNLVLIYYAFQMMMGGMKVLSTAMQIPMAIPYAPLFISGLGMFVEEAVLIRRKWMEYKNEKTEKGGSAA